MRRFIGSKTANYLLAVALLLGGWHILTLFHEPFIVPSIKTVAVRFADILSTGKSWRTIGLTSWRLLAGLGLGVAAGSGLGILLGKNRTLREIFRPLLGLLQAVPPVSWLVMALIWFGFDGRPSIFIVALSALPSMTVNLVEGVSAIDPKLLEMGVIYRFSRIKRLRYIIVPSVLPYFRSGLRIAVGLGCKGVVMGEVLTTDTGIGGAITDARQNIEPESVIAWTLVVVVMYYLLDLLTSASLRGRGDRAC